MDDSPTQETAVTETAVTPLPQGVVVRFLAAPKIGEFFAALARVLAKITTLPKDGFNQHFQYSYLKEAQAAEMLRPLLAAEGVSIMYGVRRVNQLAAGLVEVTLEIVMGDKHGNIVSTEMTGWAKDTTDKGVYKAITGTFKYWEMKTFFLSTDDDPEQEEDGKPDQGKGKAQGKRDPKPNGKAQGNKTQELIKDAQKTVVEHPTKEQIKEFFSIAKANQWPDGKLKELLGEHGFEASSEITKKALPALVKAVSAPYSAGGVQ